MIACHCLGISDRRIAAEVAAGARTLDDVAARCGAGDRCGGCQPALEDIVREVAVSIDAHRIAA